MPVGFTTFGATLADLQSASPDRLAEANELLGHNRHGSAIALSLYALEIDLKVRIASDSTLTPCRQHSKTMSWTGCW